MPILVVTRRMYLHLCCNVACTITIGRYCYINNRRFSPFAHQGGVPEKKLLTPCSYGLFLLLGRLPSRKPTLPKECGKLFRYTIVTISNDHINALRPSCLLRHQVSILGAVRNCSIALGAVVTSASSSERALFIPIGPRDNAI